MGGNLVSVSKGATKNLSVSLQRSFEPPEVKHDRLMIISVGGFLVNLIGIFVFHHGGSGKVVVSPSSLPPLSVVTAHIQVTATHMDTRIMDTRITDTRIMDTHMDITTPTTMAIHILAAPDRPRSYKVSPHLATDGGRWTFLSHCVPGMPLATEVTVVPVDPLRDLPAHRGRHVGQCWCDHFLRTHSDLW